MKSPQEMSVTELRVELQRVGISSRYLSIIYRELAAVDARINASGGDRYTAHMKVLDNNGMLKKDKTLNRRGELFAELTAREEETEQAAAA